MAKSKDEQVPDIGLNAGTALPSSANSGSGSSNLEAKGDSEYLALIADWWMLLGRYLNIFLALKEVHGLSLLCLHYALPLASCHSCISLTTITMADPFEVRMRFTSQLVHLNASVNSAQKAAHYAIKYHDMDEDLHSCILEQLEKVSLEHLH